jgi:tripartite ATP-independent transporter DctM subunit
LIIGMISLLMIALMLIGVPLVYSIGLSSALILVLDKGYDISFLASRMFKGINSYSLMALPFFLLMAEFLSSGGLVKRIIMFSNILIGHIRGGLAQVNILASMLFAGIQGSCTADSAAIGGMLIPMMIEEGYDKDISVVVTATSSCIGPIIPPSILMLLYGFLTDTSIAKLFMGALLPGIIFGLVLMVLTYYWCVKRCYKKHREKMAPFSEICKEGIKVLPAVSVPLIIVGGILTGIVTPTESGIVGCLISFLLGVFYYRELSFKKIKDCFIKTSKTTATIFAIIAAASLFAELLIRALFDESLKSLLIWLTSNPSLMLLYMAIIFLFLGMLIDTTPLMTMFAVSFFRVGVMTGIDPIHMGVVLLIAALVGSNTPPVAVLLSLNCGIGKIRMNETFKILPSYILTMILVVIICVFVPSLSTWLPGLIK